MTESKANRGTFNVRIGNEERARLEALKRHPRETFGDIVHRLLVEELARRDDEDHASSGAAEEAA